MLLRQALRKNNGFGQRLFYILNPMDSAKFCLGQSDNIVPGWQKGFLGLMFVHAKMCTPRSAGINDNEILESPFMNSTSELPISTSAAGDALLPELSALLVTALNLDLAPDQISPDESLYGEGLGLDSIDILEIALVVSKKYGFQLSPDDESNKAIFTSLRHLARHIAQHRTV